MTDRDHLSAEKIFAVLALLVLTACDPPLEYGPEQTEQGKVLQLIYVPSGHGSDVAIGYNMGKGGGVTVTPIEVNIPARYGIVFQCEHGTFAVEKHQEIWKTLQQGQEVTIRYRVVYRTKNKIRQAVDLDFIGVAQ